ncbi:hypothetical protein ABAC460_01845 [Asticcacaulis sp. AC460]|uniref:TraB/GumN family protein n=1 Tax=Asticcacaulis sp. AC460 TaxID=1282360 RepID=UPI0003C3BCBE|nr:TraB/GumN family protein [Asticcacaulis sp. AC460]ESQ93020.1 hypothetical protein ABAC460_01845 [Asticcacaulis sp. AC460]
MAALVALLLTTAPEAWAETKIPAAQAAQISPRPPMWVIRDKDSTVYLFGTIHAMRDGVEWMTPAVRESFDASADLWLEIADMDDTAKLQGVAMKYMLDPAGQLTAGLTPEEVADLDRRLQACGVSAQQLMMLRKFAVGLFLVQCQFKAMGLDQQQGIDMTLLKRARGAGKPVHGLETMEEQMEALTPDTPEDDLKALRLTLKELDRTPEIIDPMITAWLAGDLKGLEAPLVSEIAMEDREGYERLIVGRNRNWVPRIKTILDGKGTVFIAVGAGHLVGEDSVIVMLRHEGIKVEAVKTGN